MDNKTKYELIIKIKDLLKDSDFRDLEDLKNYDKILYNAEKTLSIIYSDAELTDMFECNVNEYKELKSDRKQYKNALTLRQQQLTEMDKLLPFQLKLRPRNQFDINNFKDELYGYSEFTVDIYNTSEKKFFDYFNNAIGFYDGNCTIFEFIDLIIAKNEEVYWNDKINFTYNEELSKRFTIWELDNIENAPYTFKIAEFYDYYYLSELVNGSEYARIDDFNYTFYLFISNRKILSDLLDCVYSADLSEEQKQEYLIKKEVNKKISKLPDALYKTFKLIYEKSDITAKQIAEIRQISTRTTENELTTLGKRLTGKSGIKAIKNFITKNRNYIGILK